MRVVSMLLLLGVVACAPQPVDPCGGSGGTGGFGAGGFGTGGFMGGVGGGAGGAGFFPGFGILGKPFEVTLLQSRFVFCGPGSTADEVFTEVLDPNNRKVTHTHIGPTSDTVFSTTVTFTPELVGSYHVTARFEPSIGTAQLDVQVAVDQSSGPTKNLSLGAGVSCSALEVMPSGLALCLSGKSLRVYRDDALLQLFNADDFATAGNLVWSTLDSVVTRRVDLGGASPLGNALELDTFLRDEIATLFAHEDEVLLMTGSWTVKVRLQGAALIEVMRAAIGMGVISAVQPREGLDGLLIISAPSTAFGTKQVCQAALPNPSAMQTCKTTGTINALGADKTGVWSHDGAGLRHDAIGADGGIVSATMSLLGVGLPDLQRHYERTPVFMSGNRGLAARYEAGEISLDLYDLEPGFTLMPSSTTTVRAQHPDGRQKLFSR